MKLYELACACYVYAGFTNFDETYCDFLEQTKSFLDMRSETHRKALLEWLNNFGCRQFEKSFYEKASQNLRVWYEEDGHLLPPLEKALQFLSDDELDNAKIAYKNLMNVKASETKRVGPTGAAKILFTLRKDAFPPWDGAIRGNRYDDSPESYRKFLITTKQQLFQLETECKEYGISLAELPELLGRSSSSLVKLVDEYNWVTITRGCLPPTLDELETWYQWARQAS